MIFKGALKHRILQHRYSKISRMANQPKRCGLSWSEYCRFRFYCSTERIKSPLLYQLS